MPQHHLTNAGQPNSQQLRHSVKRLIAEEDLFANWITYQTKPNKC